MPFVFSKVLKIHLLSYYGCCFIRFLIILMRLQKTTHAYLHPGQPRLLNLWGKAFLGAEKAVTCIQWKIITVPLELGSILPTYERVLFLKKIFTLNWLSQLLPMYELVPLLCF